MRKALSFTTIAIALASVAPAGASQTSIGIDSVVRAGSRVTVTGTAVVGDDMTGALEVLADPAGDDTDAGVVPNGLDIGTGSIALASDGKLVFTINTYDMAPASGPSPTFVYNWNVAVDGVDAGYFVQAGYVGGWFPQTFNGAFFNLCQRAGQVSCTSLGNAGTMGNDVVTVRVSPSQIGAKAGSIIDAGSAGGTTCYGVCSTWQPVVAVLYNTGGDQAAAGSYLVPGGVQLAVAAAGTEPDAIDWSKAVLGKVAADGTFTGTFTPQVALVSGTTYEAAARTCGGDPYVPTCVTTTTEFIA